MISYRELMLEVINERKSFSDLLANSDVERAKRANQVRTKSLRVKPMDTGEAWTFSYKSQGQHSTTGVRHKGQITFFKEDVSGKENAADLECMVDCSCPDYKYRWAYNNAKVGAGQTGGGTLNQNNGAQPTPRNDLEEGLCKHLIALGEYLNTTISAPEPEDQTLIQKVTQPTPSPQSARVPTPIPNPTSQAPSPDDISPYSDIREQTGKSNLYRKIEALLNKEFDVWYE